MKRIFRPEKFFTVADGTQVSAILNATDTTLEGGPAAAIDQVSIAAGRIAPGVKSWIHTHPALTQVTYVVAGDLTVKMKDPHQPEPYRLTVPAGSAVASEPGTLLQLHNETSHEVEVLYIASPSYVLETDAHGKVVHEDSILVAEDWDGLGSDQWDAYVTDAAKRKAQGLRADALERIGSRGGSGDA
jgi:mannose-6-phosphate isomerase-like protein (cupin superfamily)